MNKQETIETPYGKLSYTIHICDSCGKESLNTDNWIYLHQFFDRFEYLLRDNERFNPFYNKTACSLSCAKILMNDAWFKFEYLWNNKNNV